MTPLAPQPPTLEKHEPPSTLPGGRRKPPGKRNGGGPGESGVSPRAGGSGRAAGGVRTQREQGELSSRGDHLTGGGQQALQPPALPAVPEWRSGAALRGKKAPARQGQPPARAGGGRTERSLLHSPCCAARRAEMGRRLPSPLRHSATGPRRTTLPPRWGCPPTATGGGGVGLRAGTPRAPCRARAPGGAGRAGNLGAPPREPGTQADGKAGSARLQTPPSDQRRGAAAAELRRPGAVVASRLCAGERSRAGVRHLRGRPLRGALPAGDWGRGPERDRRALPAGCQHLAHGEGSAESREFVKPGFPPAPPTR